MSWLSKCTRPASGSISPESCPISVVLPAPFGPMMACSSPAEISSTMLSDATTPPKRLVKPSIWSIASATAAPRDQPFDAASRIDHDQQQHRTEDELPVFLRGGHLLAGDEMTGDADQMRQRLLQHQQRDRADHRPDHRSHAAEHRHDDQVAGP